MYQILDFYEELSPFWARKGDDETLSHHPENLPDSAAAYTSVGGKGLACDT